MFSFHKKNVCEFRVVDPNKINGIFDILLEKDDAAGFFGYYNMGGKDGAPASRNRLRRRGTRKLIMEKPPRRALKTRAKKRFN
jgi:hypothetical protein